MTSTNDDTNLSTPLTELGYREIAERYDLGSVKFGGDFQLTAGGDLKLTRDFDIQIGDNTHNALHRLVVRWQFIARMINTMLTFIRESQLADQKYQEERELAASTASRRAEAREKYHAIQHELGVNEFATEAYAGTIAVVLHSLLRREWADLNLSENQWNQSGKLINAYSFGRIIEAAANNFRHHDEWAAAADANNHQLKSMKVIAAVLGTTMQPDGRRHPFRSNVCPEIIRTLSDLSFETLMDKVFEYARSLTNLPAR